jgi:hypothetical protein
MASRIRISFKPTEKNNKIKLSAKGKESRRRYQHDDDANKSPPPYVNCGGIPPTSPSSSSVMSSISTLSISLRAPGGQP